jgi:hypothetical protein
LAGSGGAGLTRGHVVMLQDANVEMSEARQMLRALAQMPSLQEVKQKQLSVDDSVFVVVQAKLKSKPAEVVSKLILPPYNWPVTDNLRDNARRVLRVVMARLRGENLAGKWSKEDSAALCKQIKDVVGTDWVVLRASCCRNAAVTWKRDGQMLVNQPVKPPEGYTPQQWSRNLDILWIKNKGLIRRRVRKLPTATPEYTNIAEVEDQEPEFAEEDEDGEFIEEEEDAPKATHVQSGKTKRLRGGERVA